MKCFLETEAEASLTKNSTLVNSNHATKVFSFNIIIKNLSLSSQKMNQFLIRLVQSNRKDLTSAFQTGDRSYWGQPSKFILSVKPLNILETSEDSSQLVSFLYKVEGKRLREKIKQKQVTVLPLSLPLKKSWTITQKSFF